MKDYNEDKFLKIEKNFPQLMELIDEKKLIPALLTCSVYSHEFVNDIMEEKQDAVDRKTELLMQVKTMGPNAYDKFITALLHSGLWSAAEILEPLLCTNYREELVNNPKYLVKLGTKKFEGSRIYKMNSSPRGYALVINIEDFHPEAELPRRDGSSLDTENLCHILQGLGYVPEKHSNLNHNEMCTTIKSFAHRSEHAMIDSCIVFIASHGDCGSSYREFVYTSEGRKLPIFWIWSQFDNLSCPSLQGKPKIFIFQSCRGNIIDQGVVTSLIHEANSSLNICPLNPIKNKYLKILTENIKHHSVHGSTSADSHPIVLSHQWDVLPTFTDMLIIYPSVLGYASLREPTQGTWLVTTLCKVLSQRACDCSLQSMMQEVSQRIRKLSGDKGQRQSITWEFIAFDKELYFNPGI